MALVWERFPSGGTSLLALLALADWANDDGGNCHPSIASIARKIRASESQARRIVHGLIQSGWVHVVGNEFGGSPKASRRYRIDIAKLEQTPSAYARGVTGARGGMGARDGSHGCAETGRIAMTPEPSVEPPITTKREKARSRADASFEDEVEVLAFLNEHAGRKFEAFDADGKPSKALQVIRCALKRITPLDARRIVILKTREWGNNPDMRRHLNPITLYGRRANLEKYLAEVREHSWGRRSA